MNYDFETITKAGCISYLRSWRETLKDRILHGDPREPLYEEQVAFLSKAILELEGEGKEICLKALQKWGAGAQIAMMFEEMSELQKELCKELRGKGNIPHIAEEIADVEIMLGQMKLLYKCESKVEKEKAYKLKRLEGLVSE